MIVGIEKADHPGVHPCLRVRTGVCLRKRETRERELRERAERERESERQR